MSQYHWCQYDPSDLFDWVEPNSHYCRIIKHITSHMAQQRLRLYRAPSAKRWYKYNPYWLWLSALVLKAELGVRTIKCRSFVDAEIQLYINDPLNACVQGHYWHTKDSCRSVGIFYFWYKLHALIVVLYKLRLTQCGKCETTKVSWTWRIFGSFRGDRIARLGTGREFHGWSEILGVGFHQLDSALN